MHQRNLSANRKEVISSSQWPSVWLGFKGMFFGEVGHEVRGMHSYLEMLSDVGGKVFCDIFLMLVYFALYLA